MIELKCTFRLVLITLSLLGQSTPGDTIDNLESDPAFDWDGAWRWNFSMPDGTVVRPKLVLLSNDGHLSGTTSFRPGSEAAITNALANGHYLRFEVVRQRDGRTITTSYSGTLISNRVEGTIESDWTGQKQVYRWEAQRAHVGADGTWTWTNSLSGGVRSGGPGRGGRTSPDALIRVVLKQTDNSLTGRVLSRAGPRILIHHGSITNNEVSFEIERTFRETSIVSTYRGKQTGDTISGSVEVELNGRTRKGPWEAKRLD